MTQPTDDSYEKSVAKANYVRLLARATFPMGSSFVAGKFLLMAGFPVMLVVGWRFSVTALAMAGAFGRER
jgi:hypothetical protein